jgi:hypothetical protein
LGIAPSFPETDASVSKKVFPAGKTNTQERKHGDATGDIGE